MRNLVVDMYATQKRLEMYTKRLEKELKEYLEFENFNVFYQPSDGWVLEYDTNNAPLNSCLDTIWKKGKLSLEDYLDYCI